MTWPTFLNPWVAAGLAAIVIPALVILYFLKLRRREELVPSTFLWKRAVQDLQVNAPFQRLRKNLLLLLQLLVLAAALLALARPMIKTDVASEKSVVILLDRSASMKTKEGDKTRFDLAKEQAVRLVKTFNRTGQSWLSSLGLGGADAKTRVMVIAFADKAKIIAPFTTNTSDVIGLIEELEPTDSITNLRDALDLAQAHLARGQGNFDAGGPPPGAAGTGTAGVQNPEPPETHSKIILLSDGCVPDLKDAALIGGAMTLIPIGAQRDNTGITSLRLARNYEKPDILNVFARVENFAPESVTTDVTLYVDGAFSQGRVETVTLGPGRQPMTQPATAPADVDEQSSVKLLNFEFPLDRGAVVEARLSRDDALAVDNRAAAIVPPPKHLRVLVVTAGNIFLENCVGYLPLEKAVFLTPAQYEAASTNELEQEGRSIYDAVIFDKWAPKTPLPTGNFLFMACIPQLPDVEVTGEVTNFALQWWDEAHPLLRYVALDRVYIANALKLSVPKSAQKLMEGQDSPVLVRLTRDGRNYLLLSFAIEMSTWWNKLSFPVFLFNAIRYFGDADLLTDQEPTRPGDPLVIQLPAGIEKAIVHRPNDKKDTLLPDDQQVARYAATHDAGIYRVEPGVPGRDRFAVNLVSSHESNITPRTDVTIGNVEVTAGEPIKAATPEIWRWFIGAALLIALIEWYIYNRRVML